MSKGESEVLDFPAEPGIPRSVSRLLVVGGSFDPPHRAHVDLPVLAAGRLNCDHMLFIPAARSPHKGEDPTSPEHRLAMLKLAVEAIDYASVSPFELEQPPPSYTIDTLRALRQAAGDGCRLYLLIGRDQARAFESWREPEEILKLVTPVVMLRAPDTKEMLGEAWANRVIDLPLMEVSATELRAMIQGGLSPRPDVLNPRVCEYIREHRLYGRRQS